MQFEAKHKNEKNHCMHGSAMQVVIGHIAFKGKWQTLTYPTSDTDDPINTKICMVDYVGDMMKPYQNGVDRMQGGSTQICNI
jgi:hypothetical protein